MSNQIIKYKYNFKKYFGYNLLGLYKSKFLGSGLDIEDISKYNFGDNIKYINWKISAKKNDFYLNKYSEDKSLNVKFFLELSENMDFGSVEMTKLEKMMEIYFFLIQCSIFNNDTISSYLYSDEIINKINSKNTNYLFSQTQNEIDKISEKVENIDINKIINFVKKYKINKNLIFILTSEYDFGKYLDELKKISVDNKIVIINIIDVLELGEENNININIGNKTFGLKNKNQIENELLKNYKALKSKNIDFLSINTTENIYKVFNNYFNKNI